MTATNTTNTTKTASKIKISIASILAGLSIASSALALEGGRSSVTATNRGAVKVILNCIQGDRSLPDHKVDVLESATGAKYAFIRISGLGEPRENMVKLMPVEGAVEGTVEGTAEGTERETYTFSGADNAIDGSIEILRHRCRRPTAVFTYQTDEWERTKQLLCDSPKRLPGPRACEARR